MDDDVELRRLRERVYGVGGTSATPATIARLVELEERVRAKAAGPVGTSVNAAAPSADTPTAAEPTAAQPTATEPTAAQPTAAQAGDSADTSTDPETVLDARPPAPRRALRWALVAVGAVALAGAGFSTGLAAASSAATAGAASASDAAPTPDPAAAMYPELTFRQTIEDAISADALRDSGIDSGTTRYIATVGDFRIYFAQPDDGDGRCIVTFTSTDNRPWSAGCASGAQQGPAVFGVADGLTVVIGDPAGSGVDGIPMRLSESVTAYVAG